MSGIGWVSPRGSRLTLGGVGATGFDDDAGGGGLVCDAGVGSGAGVGTGAGVAPARVCARLPRSWSYYSTDRSISPA